jgi:hypothetical protein
MVRGELGVFPIDIIIKSRLVNFWCRIINSDLTRTSSILYKLLFSIQGKDNFNSSWITFVKNTLDQNRFSFIWTQQKIENPLYFKNVLNLRIKDQFIQEWFADVWDSSSCYNYRIFKTSFALEDYLIKLFRNFAIDLCRFRTGCTKIPFVLGKFNNIDKEDRICHLCNTDIGDEYHYLFVCNSFIKERSVLKNILVRTPTLIKWKYCLLLEMSMS